MNIIKKSNYLPSGAVVFVKAIKDYDRVGVVIHPISVPKDIVVKGYVDNLLTSMPIIRTATSYYRLYPSDDVEVLYEPVDNMEFKPKETILYPIEIKSDY